MRQTCFHRSAFIIACLATFFSWNDASPQSDIPERGDRTRSMGLPQRWKPDFGVMADWERRGNDRWGAELSVGMHRDFGNPLIGLMGGLGEVYGRSIDGAKLDGGTRIMATNRFMMLQLGADYAFRDSEWDFALGFTPFSRRGGTFGRGDALRFLWYPGRSHSFKFGISIPIFQPYVGNTRPQNDDAPVLGRRKRHPDPVTPGPQLVAEMARVSHGVDWINRLTTPFFDQYGGNEESHIAKFLEKVDAVESHLVTVDTDFPKGHSFTAEIDAYHAAVTRAFGIAATGAVDDAAGRPVWSEARELIFDEVLAPYNRLLGQRKTNDSLRGLSDRAAEVFRAWLRTQSQVAPAHRTTVMWVFVELLSYFEENRDGAREVWGDSRLVWLPLHYAVPRDAHDSQEEIDDRLERLLDQKFTTGNDIHYVINELFHLELSRMIHAAREYHVLWIHDYRGVTEEGKPDKIAFKQTVDSYLSALTDRVREYDETRRIPTYMVYLDQFFYEPNEGWLFLDLLQDPLRKKINLPKGYEDWEATLTEAQDALREAVENSTSLQAGAREYGQDWLRNRIKVHVNITNPQDHSFRSNHLVPHFFFLPDVMLRDHRKISFYDVTELDPAMGEAIFTGVGVGDHYAGPTWEDRSLLARGPALVSLKTAARKLLESQGFADDDIPVALRPLPLAVNYDERVQALVAQGWDTRAMQVHNQVGYGQKDCNLVKAGLYDLMPAGSHMYIPDSLWNSAFWAGMLTGSAMRGCKVLVVSPALANAPSSGKPQMSRANEIFTRFIVLQDRLADTIAAAGGALHTGVYAVDVGVGDMHRVDILSDNIKKHPFLREIFPFDDAVYDRIFETDRILRESGVTVTHLTKDQEHRVPKLHLKTQMFLSPEVMSSLIPLPEWTELVEKYIAARARQMDVRSTHADAKSLREALSGNAKQLGVAWEKRVPVETRERTIGYFTIGSHNQDYRGKIMDGEVLYTVAGTGALVSYLDFFTVLGLTTWVDSIEELEELIPRESGMWQSVGRLIKNAL